MPAFRQFSVGYLLSEIALIAIAIAAGRMVLLPSVNWLEIQAMCFCIALTAGFGALGGLGLRMAVGLIAGGVLAMASIPLFWLLISTTADPG